MVCFSSFKQTASSLPPLGGRAAETITREKALAMLQEEQAVTCEGEQLSPLRAVAFPIKERR